MPHGSGARRDLLSAAGLGLVAVVYLAASRSYPLDTLAAPGPGVFPLAAGALALLLAVGQIAGAVVRRQDAGAEPPQSTSRRNVSERAIGSGRGWAVSDARGRDLASMVVLLVAYAAAVGTVGFLASSLVLVALASRLLGAQGWRRPVALAVGVTAVAWVIFVAWLGVPLPAGLLR